MSQPRKYDLVLLGATGYTGALTAAYISEHYPNDVKWAIAGRNASKLAKLAHTLEQSGKAKAQPPAIEPVVFDEASLAALAKSTQVVISTVGPFSQHGSLPFQACAENGTHYVDSTGETPWFSEMVAKYHDTAVASGAIMIPMCGFDCVPSDITTWVAVDYMRRVHASATARTDVCIYAISGGVSGGTLASFVSALDMYTVKELIAILEPYRLSPRVPEHALKKRSRGFAAKYLGLQKVDKLGWMGYTPQGPIDRSYVNRSWGLLSPQPDAETAWGENFDFHAWGRMPGPVSAVLYHWAFMAIVGLFTLKPFRRMVQRLWYKPGTGTDVGALKKNYLEYHALAQPDCTQSKSGSGSSVPPVKVRMRYDGDPYLYTAVTLGEGAMVILRDQGTEAHKMGGGVLTSATLGQPFVDRLRAAGVVLEVHDA